MAGSQAFIKEYGEKSFDEFPFCDGDNLAICSMFYMPFENVVSDSFDESISLDEAFEKLFEFRGGEHKAIGLLINPELSKNTQYMTSRPRYSRLKMTGVRSVYEHDPAVQFAACTLLMPNGDNIIIFRGTDDSITGWKEDLDIYTKKSIPSHALAVDYINEAAEKLDGKFIILGHSKGGNVALYGALKCSEEARARIKELYNNDGPGFFDHSMFRSDAYSELLPRYHHIVPDSSFVGMLLAHDDDYKAVKSNKLIGVMQHDMGTWQLKDGNIVERSISRAGRITDITVSNIISNVNDAQRQSIDTVVSAVVTGLGQETLLDFSKNAVKAIDGAVKAVKGVDKETRNEFKSSFKGTIKFIFDASREVTRERIPLAVGRVKTLVKSFAPANA